MKLFFFSLSIMYLERRETRKKKPKGYSIVFNSTRRLIEKKKKKKYTRKNN
jgi:hypothetical protein